MTTPVTVAELVDQIGKLKAQIAPTLARLAQLEKSLKANGPGRYHGDLYEAKIFESLRRTLDMEAVRAKLSPQFIAAHTTESTSTTLKVTARQLSDESVAA